jgi:hypothetical protein
MPLRQPPAEQPFSAPSYLRTQSAMTGFSCIYGLIISFQDPPTHLYFLNTGLFNNRGHPGNLSQWYFCRAGICHFDVTFSVLLTASSNRFE